VSRNAYGSRRDSLPRFTKAHESIQRYSVRILDLDESRDLENLSLNRFPHTSAGVIGWAGIGYTERVRFANEEEGWRLLQGLVSRMVEPESEVAVFWGTLVMPTVVLMAEGVTTCAAEIVEAAPSFWIYLRESNVLIEFAVDGQITLAEIPDE
jgi:hypothetical protein